MAGTAFTRCYAATLFHWGYGPGHGAGIRQEVGAMVPAAFAGVVLIWATTPVAIKWSSEGAGFLFGVSSRMVLGAMVCAVLLAMLGRRL